MIKSLNKIYDDVLINFEISKLQDLSQEYSKFRINKKDLRKKIKLSISSDYTTNYFIEILKLFLINKKIQPDVCYSEFGSLRYNIRNLKSNFWNKDNDFIILIPSSQNFSFFPEIQDSKKIIKQKAISEAQLWLDAWSKVDKNIIQTTFDPPLIPRFGNEDAVRYGGGLHFIRLVNSILIDNLPPHVNLIDIENLIKIDLEIKERILSEWERTYSDLEYMDSIENNYKNMFPEMNEYQTYDKSMKLLNFIYKKTKISEPGYDNYLSKPYMLINKINQNSIVINLTFSIIAICCFSFPSCF